MAFTFEQSDINKEKKDGERLSKEGNLNREQKLPSVASLRKT